MQINAQDMKISRSAFVMAFALSLSACSEADAVSNPAESEASTEASQELTIPNPELGMTMWVVGSPTNQAIFRMETARTKDERAVGLSGRENRGEVEGMALIGSNSIEPISITRLARPINIASVDTSGKITKTARHEASSSHTSFEPPANTTAILLLEDDVLGRENMKEGADALLMPGKKK